jgi:hypothetical protein
LSRLERSYICLGDSSLFQSRGISYGSGFSPPLASRSAEVFFFFLVLS